MAQSQIRVYPCLSVVYDFFVRFQLWNLGLFHAFSLLDFSPQLRYPTGQNIGDVPGLGLGSGHPWAVGVMRLEDLQSFCHVAETGSLNEAARRDGITSGSACTRLVTFEHELDLKLIHRQRRKNRPTVAGRLVYDYARRILDLCDQAKARMRKG